MKLIRKISIALVFFLLLSTTLIWILTRTITPETIKDYVSQQLSLLTHQATQIEGEFSWQIFPRPGVKITKIHIGNQPKLANFSLDIDNLLLNLHLSPLFRGNLVFNEIIMDGFQISLNSHSHAAPRVASKLLNSVEPSAKQENRSLQFAIHRLLLMHGRLIINQDSQKINLRNVQIEAQQLNLSKDFFPLQIKTMVDASLNQHAMKATINYKGRIGFNAAMVSNPIQALQQIIMDGQLLIQNIQLDKIKISKISANVKTRHGEISLNPLNLSLYDGQSIGDLNYQFITKKLYFNQTATNLDASELTKDITGNPLIKGNLDLSIHANTFAEESEWQNRLQGSGNITVKDGLFYGIDFNQLVHETTEKLHILIDKDKHDANNLIQWTQSSSAIGRNASTPFQLLNIKYNIERGQVIDHELFLQTEKLQLKGTTQINLTNTNLNGHLIATLQQADSKIDKIQQMLGGGFPFKVSGTYKRPIVLPDTQIMNPAITQFLFKKALDKPVKQLKQELDNLLTTSENDISDNLE